jgi:hypothetical protein
VVSFCGLVLVSCILVVSFVLGRSLLLREIFQYAGT